MKQCSICKNLKSVEDYNKNKTKKDGLNTMCKKCSRERSKRYYKENSEVHKVNVQKRNLKQKKVIYDFLLSHFAKNPCKDCGNDDVRVLEFDHLPEHKKEFDISLGLKNNYSKARMQGEIDKCDVVCANCHKIRTVERTKNHYRKQASKAHVEVAPDS